MKLNLIIFLSFFVAFNGFASGHSDTIGIRYTIGVAPSAILNSAPAIQLSHELRLSKRFRLGVESGFIFGHINQANKRTQGYRLRPKIKYTFYEREALRTDLFLFYNYRYYISKRETEIFRAGGAYSEIIRGSRKTILEGYGLGIDFSIPVKDQPFSSVDFGCGVGLGNLTNNYSNDIFEPNDLFTLNIDREGVFTMPIIFMNLRFMFF